MIWAFSMPRPARPLAGIAYDVTEVDSERRNAGLLSKPDPAPHWLPELDFVIKELALDLRPVFASFAINVGIISLYIVPFGLQPFSYASTVTGRRTIDNPASGYRAHQVRKQCQACWRVHLIGINVECETVASQRTALDIHTYAHNLGDVIYNTVIRSRCRSQNRRMLWNFVPAP